MTIRSWLRAAAVPTALVVIAGCGALGGEQAPEPGADGAPAPAAITVSIMPTTDLAPFHLAVQNGYFAAEGLQVETVTAPSGQASLSTLIGGDVDIAYSSYTPFFVAQDKKAADLRFVAAASSAAPQTTMIVAMPGSAVRGVADLAGKRIAVTATNTISDVLVKTAMRQNGVDPGGVEWISIPFPDTAAALERGDVDAAFLTEPFITLAARDVGAVPIVDTATGVAADLPTAGYAALEEFTTTNPETVASFQRALERATAEARDRSLVEPLLVQHSGIDAEVASTTALLTFHSAIDPAQLQRVADLLADNGVTTQRVDVAAMVAPAPS
ncbi:ABC transporter substrate-binding protein [Pseudonocardia sp. MH-G8]|uniref:ABC transporter substrate-binding protein n=1 Tax=Pseudonocardia sp. MH-G8 TaxID=1854588 RepID=UPI000B9FE26A|nr:ABC transporter substrate-binding protein [Pseudonocardia sp. MH-G8]OZM81387.1 sulfonate ABC transporter substrate-binding protein [Pseudonocardia sp. MH-G8]